MTLLNQIVNELPADWKPFTRGVATHELGISLEIDTGVRIDVVTVIDHKLWAKCKAPPIEVTLHVSGRQPTVGDAHTIPELVQKMAKMIAHGIVSCGVLPYRVPLCISGDVRMEIDQIRGRLDEVSECLTNMGGRSHLMDRLMTIHNKLNGDK